MATGFHQIPYIRGYPIEYTVLMKVIAFPHARNEPMGLLATILQENKILYEYVMPMEGDRVSARDAPHLAFPCGPMSVNDTREYPCLQEEKALIRSWVSLGKPVLAICLVAQLIAGAFGAAVFPCFCRKQGGERKKRQGRARHRAFLKDSWHFSSTVRHLKSLRAGGYSFAVQRL